MKNKKLRSESWHDSSDDFTNIVNINPVIDQSAALSDPTNPSFSPQTNAELLTALQGLIQSSGQAPGEIFDLFKKALEHSEEKVMKQKDMHQEFLESVVRKAVRKMIREAGGMDPLVYHGDTYTSPKGKGIACSACDTTGVDKNGNTCKVCKGTGYVKKDAKNLTMTDVGGSSLQQVADDLNMSVAGVKRVFDHTMDKLKVAAEYVKYLETSGELSDEDVEELMSNLGHLFDSPEFKEFYKDRKGV